MTNPTEGPCFVENNQVWHEAGLACIAEAYSGVASLVQPDQDQCETNAHLICAAFNAAHEARKLGFDPIGAVEALPELLEALEFIDGLSCNYEPDLPMPAEHVNLLLKELRAALDKARTRKE